MSTVTEFYLFQQKNLKLSRSTAELCNFNKQHMFIAVVHRLQEPEAFTEVDTPLMKGFKFYLRLAGQRRRWQILRSRKLLSSQSTSGELCLRSQLLWLLPGPETNTCFSAMGHIYLYKIMKKKRMKGKNVSKVSWARCESTVFGCGDKETWADRSEKGQN